MEKLFCFSFFFGEMETYDKQEYFLHFYRLERKKKIQKERRNEKEGEKLSPLSMYKILLSLSLDRGLSEGRKLLCIREIFIKEKFLIEGTRKLNLSFYDSLSLLSSSACALILCMYLLTLLMLHLFTIQSRLYPRELKK